MFEYIAYKCQNHLAPSYLTLLRVRLSSVNTRRHNWRRSEFSTYENYFIWFSYLRSRTIIFATWIIPEIAEDDTHGAAVVILLQDFALS